jgi:flagellar motor switch protein FliN
MASESTGPETDNSAEPASGSGQTYAPDELAAGVKNKATNAADVNLKLVLEVPVTLSLQVGSTELPIRDLVKLVEGSVVALDRESTQPMDVLVNGTLIAHGEIVLVDDQFGVRLTDVVSPLERIEKIAR